MTLNVQGYFNALRSYLNTSHYEVTETDGGHIVMREKVFVRGSPKPIEYRARLAVTGEALVVNLDKKNRNGNSDPLFHFLNDNAQPWSKRCDFIVFHRMKQRINVHCFEFKPTTLPDALVDEKPLYLAKFVLSCHPNPAPYVDAAGKNLGRDYCIRHFLYQDIDGLSLDALDNTNVDCVN